MLLDTHALIWLVAGDERLGREARDGIEAARLAGALLVSPLSFFEAATLVRRGRVDLRIPLDAWIAAITDSVGIGLAPVEIEIASAAGQLTDDLHGDPMDRLLVATARHHAAPLVTADRQILRYAAAGHLQVIDARH